MGRCRAALVSAPALGESLPEGELRGHSFHYSTCETNLRPIAHGVDPNGGPTHEAVYRVARVTASSVHLYFPSNRHAVVSLFSP